MQWLKLKIETRGIEQMVQIIAFNATYKCLWGDLKSPRTTLK